MNEENVYIVFEDSKFVLTQFNDKIGCKFKEMSAQEFKEVAKNALEKMREIEDNKSPVINVGDTVEIVDNEYALCQYDDFFSSFDVPMIYGIKYRYGVYPENGMKGKIVYVKDNLCVVKVEKEPEIDIVTGKSDVIKVDSCIYLMNCMGLKKAD